MRTPGPHDNAIACAKVNHGALAGTDPDSCSFVRPATTALLVHVTRTGGGGLRGSHSSGLLEVAALRFSDPRGAAIPASG